MPNPPPHSSQPSPPRSPHPAAATPLTVLNAGPRANRASAREALGTPGSHPPVRSLYIHTPFCVHKCHYCDFYSFVDTKDQQPAFVARLIDELAALAPHAAGAPLKTIFIGGGTPSLLRVELWRELLAAIDRHFDLSLIRARHAEAEWTVECNPESTSRELCETLVAGGVDRVSVGAQSFHPRHLKTLERWHNPDNVAKALDTARAAGIPRVSLDLIFAIPGQTLAEWESDLRTALALGTTHLSAYNLTYEPNTAMTVRLKRGEFEPVDEDVEAAMFERAGELLTSAGLERYEVSNYARPGHESRHNLAYWRQEQWLAAGPSASGHVFAAAGEHGHRAGGHRWKNIPRLMDYLDAPPGFAPITDHEPPDPARAVRERIMTGLRLREGLDGSELLADADAAAPGAAGRLRLMLAQMRADRHVEEIAGRWKLTPAGILLADHLAGELMACV
jgi:oxygen-independent coproporphyrinogen III oxidase